MTDSHFDNSNNGDQSERPQQDRPAHEGAADNGNAERPVRRDGGNGGDHWYNQFKPAENSGDDRPQRSGGKDAQDDSTSGSGRSFRPYRRDDNTSGYRRPYRPYRQDGRDENGAGGNFRPYRRDDNASGGGRSYRPYKRDDNGTEGGDRPYRRPFNRDENGTNGDRPYRPYKPYKRDDNAAEGGDRPYRRPYKPYNRDENGTEGGDRPYRRPFNRDENNTEGGDRPYRRPYNRDENGAGGDRPYRRPFNRDGAEGGDRPYRRPYKPYNRDENGTEGGDRPYRRPFNRDENGTEGGDRPYRRPFNRDENGAGGDRPYRRPFNRDENGTGGERPYRRPFNRDENGTEGGDRPYRRPFNRDENGDRPPRSPRRFGDPRENGPVDEMSERSVIDSNRKDDIAISGDRPYRPYSPYLMEDDNGVMHASYRPFKKSYEVDANGIAHPPRKTEGQEGEETRPPRDFGDRNDAKDTDKATWSFSTQDDKTDGDDKPLTEHDGDDMHLEEALSAAETQTETQSGSSAEAAEQSSETAMPQALTENGTEAQDSENKDDGLKDTWPRHDRFSRRDGDGFDRPRRRFDRGDGDGYDRPRRRFDRDGNGDSFDRPPRRRFGRDENNNAEGEQPQNGVNETGEAVNQNQEEAEKPLPYARKQRIAVFGGSFDPIHNGHLLIAQKVLELDKADEVLFVPALLPPHKMNRLVATPEQRLEMIKLALGDNAKFSVTDVELQRTGAPSYTFDTMSILKQIYSDCELFLLIGMDSLVGLNSWYRATELVTRGKFIIYPRPGVERPPIFELEKEFGSKNAYKLTYSIMDNEELAQSDISSTAVREAIAQHLSPEKYVPQAVAQYIHDNNIYS